jgi:hypothetical protein
MKPSNSTLFVTRFYAPQIMPVNGVDDSYPDQEPGEELHVRIIRSLASLSRSMKVPRAPTSTTRDQQ